MGSRWSIPIGTVSLLAAVWALGAFRHEVLSSLAAPGQVRILSFHANAGAVNQGESALLCYGVANARAVRILPFVPGVAPSSSHCVKDSPTRTTHHTLMAEGFDGSVAARSLTLQVLTEQPDSDLRLYVASLTSELH
jgi:hypothetical protein